MTDPSMTSETPDVAEIVSFLHRFSDLLATGPNAKYLRRAAELLETLTVRVIAASDQEDLWRFKCESLSRHADVLEAECDALKHDVEGHLDITSAVLAERDALGATLQTREAELSELRDALSRERDERAAKTASHEEALAGLRLAFDQKHEGLRAALEARAEECEELRRAMERVLGEGVARTATHEAELSGLRLAFDRERGELQDQLKARDDELAVSRLASEREQDLLKEKIAFLEDRRTELRSAFDRISHLREQAIKPRGAGGIVPGRPAPEEDANPHPGEQGLAGETNAIVPKTTLRQARAQFEYLAKEFIPLGDIASQVMCELGAYTMDLALIEGQAADRLPVGEVARSILAPAANAGHS